MLFKKELNDAGKNMLNMQMFKNVLGSSFKIFYSIVQKSTLSCMTRYHLVWHLRYSCRIMVCVANKSQMSIMSINNSWKFLMDVISTNQCSMSLFIDLILPSYAWATLLQVYYIHFFPPHISVNKSQSIKKKKKHFYNNY